MKENRNANSNDMHGEQENPANTQTLRCPVSPFEFFSERANSKYLFEKIEGPDNDKPYLLWQDDSKSGTPAS